MAYTIIRDKAVVATCRTRQDVARHFVIEVNEDNSPPAFVHDTDSGYDAPRGWYWPGKKALRHNAEPAAWSACDPAPGYIPKDVVAEVARPPEDFLGTTGRFRLAQDIYEPYDKATDDVEVAALVLVGGSMTAVLDTLTWETFYAHDPRDTDELVDLAETLRRHAAKHPFPAE